MINVRTDLGIAFDIKVDGLNGNKTPVVWEENGEFYSTFSQKEGRVKMRVEELWACVLDNGRIIYGKVALDDPRTEGTFAYRLFGRSSEHRPDQIDGDTTSGNPCPVHEYPARVHLVRTYKERMAAGEIFPDKKTEERLRYLEKELALA
jgi:hypothetical protein